MKKRILSGVGAGLLCMGCGLALALDPADMARFAKAGISSATIQTIIEEKAVETCAFTVDEIIDLKKSGMSDEAIRGIVRQGSFMKGPRKIVYGETTKSLKSITPEDMIRLKKAGISDQTLTEIARGNMDRDNVEHRRAWDMLDSMGLIVDERSAGPVPVD